MLKPTSSQKELLKIDLYCLTLHKQHTLLVLLPIRLQINIVLLEIHLYPLISSIIICFHLEYFCYKHPKSIQTNNTYNVCAKALMKINNKVNNALDKITGGWK